MADLKLLTERVVEKEKAALRQKVDQAKIEAEDDIQAFEANELSKREQLKKDAKVTAEREFTIKKNTLDIQKRNDVLAAKQIILSKVFVDAKDRLDHLEKPAFEEFVLNVLNQFDSEEEIKLTLGQKSADLIDENWLKANVPSVLSVNLSDETIRNNSGLVVEKNGIDYNFLFDTLVEDIKTDIIADISKELF